MRSTLQAILLKAHIIKKKNNNNNTNNNSELFLLQISHKLESLTIVRYGKNGINVDCSLIALSLFMLTTTMVSVSKKDCSTIHNYFLSWSCACILAIISCILRI